MASSFFKGGYRKHRESGWIGLEGIRGVKREGLVYAML